MPAIDNLVHETSASNGAGTLSLSAVDGRQTFASAFGTGGTDVFYYFISHRTAGEWEVGTGHLGNLTTLVRDTVLASSNAGSAVPFSAGLKDVSNDIPAIHLPMVSVGDVKFAYRQAPEPRWEAMDGSTIGSGASAANLANDAYEALFLHLWNEDSGVNNLSVSPFRGASAASDWSANRTITLPDARAHAFGMINNSSLPNTNSGSFTTRDMGDTVGTETHTLTEAELDAHSHNVPNAARQNATNLQGGGTNTRCVGDARTATNTGGSSAHNNMQPTFFMNAFIYSGV